MDSGIMKKSYYTLLTIVAACAATFFLGRWVGMGFRLHQQQVLRSVHEAWGRAADACGAHAASSPDSLFRAGLRDAGLMRLNFRLDTVAALSEPHVALRAALPYYDDYAPLLREGYTFSVPLENGEYLRARLLNLRAETVGGQLYYLLGTLIGIGLLGYGIAKQVDVIRRQDKMARMREDFSYAMIHDMKTPISSILFGLKMLRTGKLDDKPEKREKTFDIAESEAQHLLELTNKVLTISKLEHGRLLLNKDWIALPPLVEDLVRTFEAKAAKPVTFRLDLREKGVYADEGHLREALANLLDNALKYSKDTVEITIASSRHDRYTQIRVRDNGIGIPLAAQRNIFDKFERVLPASGGKQEGKKVSGFGLGLNYVMNVAREHGGYVSVESVPGKFSEFTISLPLPPAPEEV